MSFASITQCTRDQALTDRIIAAVNKEVVGNPTLAATQFGQQVQQGVAPIHSRFAYPIAIDNEAAYASALAANNPNPGGDEAVITDGNLTAGVQAHWPEDQEPV